MNFSKTKNKKRGVKTVKKVLSLIVAFAMLLSFAAISAYASTETILAQNPLTAIKYGASDPFQVAYWADSGFRTTDNTVEIIYTYKSNANNRRQTSVILRQNQISGGTVPSGSVTEFKFKINGNTMTDVEYYPLTFTADGTNVSNALKTLYIKNGNLYAVKSCSASNGSGVNYSSVSTETICTIKTDVWYTVSLIPIFSDGTTNASYSFYVTDGSETYRGSNYILGVPLTQWHKMQANLQSIPTVVVAGANGQDSEAAKTPVDGGTTYPTADGVFIKDLKIYTTDFTEELQPAIFENSGVRPGLSDSGNGGFYWKGSWDEGYTPTNETVDGRTVVKMPGKSAISSGQKIPNWRTTTELGSGSFMVEGTFKFENAQAQYYPITFHTDLGTNVNRQIKTVWAENGKFYAKGADAPNTSEYAYWNPGKEEICSLDPTKWYNVKIYINCDGNPSTVDTYNYELSDGSSVYSGGPYAFGQAMNDSQLSQYELSGIVSVGFGTCGYANGVEGITYIDNLRAINNMNMTASASGRSVTFSEPIEARTLNSVTLTSDGAPYPFTSTLSADGKTLSVDFSNLDFGKTYTFTVPKNVVSKSNRSLAEALTLDISAPDSENAVQLSGSITGTLESGGKIRISAVCKNLTDMKADLTVKAVIKNAEGEVLSQAYTIGSFKGGTEKNSAFTMDVPNGAASAELSVYAQNGELLAELEL